MAAAGARVVAVVAQRSEKVRRYIEETGLPFDILIDDGREVVKAYGVWHRVGLDAWNIARPAAFVIGPDGLVRYAYVASWQHDFAPFDDLIAAVRSAGAVGRDDAGP